MYAPRYELIKTTCYTDLVIADPDYLKKLLLASLAGDDSSVKAIAAAIIEHRELHLLTLDGRTETWLRSEGKHRLLVSKTPEGHAHVLVLSHRALPGEGDVLLCWDGDPAGALGKRLLSATDLPLLPDWVPRYWAAAQARGMIQVRDVWAEKDAPVTAFRLAQDPERWEGLLGESVREGELEIPDGGGDSPAEVGSGKLDGYLLDAREYVQTYAHGDAGRAVLRVLADVEEVLAVILAGQDSSRVRHGTQGADDARAARHARNVVGRVDAGHAARADPGEPVQAAGQAGAQAAGEDAAHGRGGPRRFLEAASGERLCALWLLPCTTALRRGELCGLRWQDVDLDAARLAVRQELIVVDGKRLFKEPNTASSVAAVPLLPEVVHALRDWLTVQNVEKATAGPLWEDHGLVSAR